MTTALTVRLEPATFSELYYLLLQFESRLEQANQQSQTQVHSTAFLAQNNRFRGRGRVSNSITTSRPATAYTKGATKATAYTDTVVTLITASTIKVTNITVTASTTTDTATTDTVTAGRTTNSYNS